MRFSVDVVPADIPKLLNRFIAITGIDPWHRREQDFAQQVRDNPLIERYLDEQFSIERSMIYTLRYREKTGRLPAMSTAGIANLFAFSGTAAHAFNRLSALGQDAVRKRLLGALKDNIGLGPFAFEMRTLAHLMAKGLDIEFHDLEAGGYDFLARSEQIEFEIECKSVSGDLGHRIHLLRQYQLGPYIIDAMRVGHIPGVVQLIVATLADRLHGQREFMTAVGARITETIKRKTSLDGYDPCAVSYAEYPIQGSPFHSASGQRITESDVSEYCSRTIGDTIGHSIMIFSPGESATVVALRSSRPNEFLKHLYRNLKEAASSHYPAHDPV